MSKGSVRIVGIGMCLPDHLTAEAVEAIERADLVYAVIDNEQKLAWLRARNPNVELLNLYYLPGAHRPQIYQNMADSVLKSAREGKAVCMVSYGHPGVYCNPAHFALRMCREEGIDARMLPGVSAMDCMFADLSLDPLTQGVQAYEGNDWLVYLRNWTGRPLRFLWQPNFIGVFETPKSIHPPQSHLKVLQEQLIEIYGPDHPWVTYRAGIEPGEAYFVESVAIGKLLEQPLHVYSTILLPPQTGWSSPDTSNADFLLVGLGRKAAEQTTAEAIETIKAAERVCYLELSEAQKSWLLQSRPDAKAWDQGYEANTVLVLAGHPSFHGGATVAAGARAAGRRPRMQVALAPEDYLYCELGFGPEDSGFQVVSLDHFPQRPEWLDPHATVMPLGGDGAPADWFADFDSRPWGDILCLFPRSTPPPNQRNLLRLSLAQALGRTVDAIQALAPKDFKRWKTMALMVTLEEEPAEAMLAKLLEWTSKLAQERLFEEALADKVDLAAADGIPKALEARPDSSFARWVSLRIHATSAREGFEQGFTEGEQLLQLASELEEP